MNSILKTEARHILMRYLVNGHATGYGVDFRTHKRVAVAQLHKEGYIDVYGSINNFIPGVSNVSHKFIQVVPTEKLIALKESLLIIDVKNEYKPLNA